MCPVFVEGDDADGDYDHYYDHDDDDYDDNDDDDYGDEVDDDNDDDGNDDGIITWTMTMAINGDVIIGRYVSSEH